MSYALIDNASLTAVQRVMGKVIVKSPDTVSGDLIALENMVQAILFYDDLVCIDNYKKEHAENRRKSFDFIKFLSPDDFALAPLEQKAKEEARALRPEICGGEFVDQDFRALLDALRLNMLCTWDLRSSVYYLTMKMLGQPNNPEFDKYSKISAAIFNELSDVGETYGHWATDARLVGSDGTVHTKEAMQRAAESKNRGLAGTTRTLDMFIASVNWLAYKTIYYSLSARYFTADTFLHPIRHAFQIHWMRKTGAYGHDFTAKLVQSLAGNIGETVTEIVDTGRSAAILIEIPVFSAWLTAQAGDVSGVLTSALELKATQRFHDIRGILREIRIAYDEEGLVEANKSVRKWQRQLPRASAELKREYGLDGGQGVQVSNLIKIYNSVAVLASLPQVPEIDARVRVPNFMQANRARAFSNLYKDMAKELTAVDRLGGMRDLMSARFVIDDRDYVPPKTEAPEYRWYASDWKRPM